jgi:hypothetical protein
LAILSVAEDNVDGGSEPDGEWPTPLSRAHARRALADADFCVMVAELAEYVPVADIANALTVSRDEVAGWAARGRELGSVPPGQLGRDPYEIAQRYAVGEISREQMIDALAKWDYVPEPRPIDYFDDIGVLSEGSFGTTVGYAFRHCLITADEYDAILNARAPARDEESVTDERPT